ncbi:hypothetical protein ACF3M1_00610 [Luteimonas sp. WGS1318]
MFGLLTRGVGLLATMTDHALRTAFLRDTEGSLVGLMEDIRGHVPWGG